MEHLKLFCIPFAGGSSLSFANWQLKIDDRIEVVPIDLSGKGKRFKEKENSSFQEAVEDVYDMITKNIGRNEYYAIFGHSMGALLAYEVYYLLKQNYFQLPGFMIMSGTTLPSKFNISKVPLNSQKEFESYIIDLGGVSKEIIKMKHVFDEIIFSVKKDYEILASYKPIRHKTMIHCPGFIFKGNNDKLTQNDCFQEWKQIFEGDIQVFGFEGNHFFINNQCGQVLSKINEIAYAFIMR